MEQGAITGQAKNPHVEFSFSPIVSQQYNNSCSETLKYYRCNSGQLTQCPKLMQETNKCTNYHMQYRTLVLVLGASENRNPPLRMIYLSIQRYVVYGPPESLAISLAPF